MTPDTMAAAFAQQFPAQEFHPLSYDLLAWQERRDWREHQQAELHGVLDELARVVADLGRRGAGRRAARADRRLLLSKAGAARLLGIDLKTTLERLIADRHIRAVKA